MYLTASLRLLKRLLHQLLLYQKTLTCKTVVIAKFLDPRISKRSYPKVELEHVLMIIRPLLEQYSNDVIHLTDEADGTFNDDTDLFLQETVNSSIPAEATVDDELDR